MVSHDHFAQRRADHRARKGGRASADPEYDRLCALVLASPPGRELLAKMRARTIDAPVNAGELSESALRALVAQSQFVREIEAAIQRGLDAMKTKGKAA